ncbi:truncated type III restriction-modification system [Chryseobacterium sp. StRB126]|uniref:DNA methyltransferase n=1 Tax=Chryseobacterium sp. StRB126 TaxID=878220 RepID=UPI0004E9830D|nr:site-specific DNA-methyltransferase [Chryseobacterium sp. StRB126]BAP30664.1 truncated type III restriction-modification system [Chryseobacterium sp. StRB126]
MKLYQTLEKQIKKEPNYVSDNGEIKKWVVLNKAQNFDEELIGLLLEDSDLKEKFFIKVKEVWVFKQNLFIQFLEQKNYLNDSYTQFKNKVGLTIDGKHLKQRNEVSLVWPFKDCILEGGQSREEDKREEIFFNEVLAQDEITELLDPKVLTNAKRFDKEGEKALCHSEQSEESLFNRNENGTITDNLIIKGNNLLALHSLKKEFAGKVKLIYIDPPYNTGNDGFKYNDSFNHSTWLTFMKNRLLVAKLLLKNNGVIFISLDDREAHYAKVLCDEVFGYENFLSDIIWNSTKSVTNTAIISNSHTHTLVYFKDKNYYVKNRMEFRLQEDGIGFSNPDNDARGVWKADPFQVGGWRPNQQYEIKNPNTGIVYKPNVGCSWKNDFTKYKELLEDNRIVFGVDGNAGPQRKRFLSEAMERGKVAKTIWDDLETTTNGTQHLKSLFSNQVFSNPKPEGFIKRIIELATNENDIILDYHLGSGTTASTAHKMNRQYIGIEQMDYIETVAVERLKKVIDGEQGGISKSVNWQGGGSFIYLELKKYNQTFIEKIEEAKDEKTLLQIWEEMKEKSFLNYNVDLQKQEQYIEDFKTLSLQEQKQHLCELLDKNQLYVNLSSLNDGNFECTPEEQKVTKAFYQLKK